MVFTVGSPIVLYKPPVEICGKPVSRGSVETPWQTDLAGERIALVEAHLAAVDLHPADADLVQLRIAEDAGVAGDQVARVRRQRAAESRDQRLLQRAGAERLQIVGVERAEAREELIGAASR